MSPLRFRTHLIVSLILLLAFTLAACGGGSEADQSEDAPAEPVSFEEATQLVINQVVKPETLESDLILFGLEEAIGPQDELRPYRDAGLTGPGEVLPISTDSWFFYIDDHPYAKFVHETRYVLVEVDTGEITISNQVWWPLLNGDSLFSEDATFWNPDNWLFSTLEERSEGSFLAPGGSLMSSRAVYQESTGKTVALLVNGWADKEKGEENFEDDITNMTEALERDNWDIEDFGPDDSDVPDKIDGWLDEKSEELGIGDTLMIYMTAHGSAENGGGSFSLGGDSYTETELVDQLKKFHPGVDIIVVLDGCYSGDWGDGLSEVADITITAGSPGEKTYFDWDVVGVEGRKDDPNTEDRGSEFTSGFYEDWEETTIAKSERDKAVSAAQENGTSYWVEVARMSHKSAVEKDSTALNGFTNPLVWDGNPITTRHIAIEPFFQVIGANMNFRFDTAGYLTYDGSGDGFLSSKDWIINDMVLATDIIYEESFELTDYEGMRSSFFNDSFFECGIQTDTHLTVCAPDAGDMPEGEVLVGIMALNDPVPLDPGMDMYQYGFVLDSDNDPANNFQYIPPYTLDYFQDTDLWYVLFFDGTSWSLSASTAQGGYVDSNARAAIIDDVLVFFVPEGEYSADQPAYRLTAFGCIDGGWGSGFCNGDVSGVDSTVPPKPIPDTTVDYEP